MDKKFIINLQGKEFIKFEGLLTLFHENGGKSIVTEELEKSTATCPMFKATVSGEKGTFTGHGDADNTNVNSMIAKHKYRMAETRAIARALRWYNNIGLCSIDELGGEEKEIIYEAPTNTAQVFENLIGNEQTPADKMKNYKKTEDNKPWITDELFNDAIEKSVKAGVFKLGTPVAEVMKILRMKYAVARKYEAMVESEINRAVLK